MCGIAGIWHVDADPGGTPPLAAVLRMTDALVHRGPDDRGHWTSDDRRLVLGHRRLSILDLSAAGAQPMASASRRWVIAFNGEIYNHAELRAGLEPRTWRGHSDTEVLLEGIDRWGVQGALERASGMFAIALWDTQERRLWLARDRAGEKPLYHGVIDGRLYFASELQAITAALGRTPQIDRAALGGYLRHGYVPGPRSILAGISKLPPGSLVEFDLEQARQGRGRLHRYWDPVTRLPNLREPSMQRGEAEFADAVERELRRSIRGQMVADVPVGAFLSGGIDSSLVVALMQQEASGPVRSFTIGFDDPKLDEAPFARAVARHLGTDHTELYVSDEQARAMVPRLATMYDEPFADSSQIPTALVAAMARQHVTVCLSGDGGDELFAGYSRYANVERQWRRLQSLPVPARRAAAALLAAVPGALWTGLGAAIGGLRGRRLTRPMGETVARVRGRLRSPNLGAFYRESLSHWTDIDALLGPGHRADDSAWPAIETLAASLSPVDLMTLADTLTYLPDDILVKVDRAAMAVSLELRAPLLDWKLIELAWRSPPSLRHRKAVLKRLAFRHVPRELLERPKQGFGVPLDVWLRGPLREWADDLLSMPHLRGQGLVAPDLVARRWSEHRAGVADWSYSLWIVLMLTQWRAEAGRRDASA